ncbi:ankyrin repeat-containing domain protein [Chytriomyces sp. MP71]|nr:ankyrin repeat-containing domain protein [Chytriomyces sp. MP71]
MGRRPGKRPKRTHPDRMAVDTPPPSTPMPTKATRNGNGIGIVTETVIATRSLPMEVLTHIVSHLPVDGGNLRTLALASRAFASIVTDFVCAQRHVARAFPVSIPDSRSTSRMVGIEPNSDQHPEWLPIAYKAALLHRRCLAEDHVMIHHSDHTALAIARTLVAKLQQPCPNLLYWCILNNHALALEHFLSNTGYDASGNDNICLRLVFSITPLDEHIVSLLLQDSRVDPSVQQCEVLVVASTQGWTRIVQSLLADKRIQPDAGRNSAIIAASKRGHLDIVKLLLSAQQVNPSANENEALIESILAGHTSIALALLQDSRVDPSYPENTAFICACQIGQADVVERLLLDKRVDPCARDNGAFWRATQNGHLDVVRLLLAIPKVNPGAQYNFSILEAAQKGFTEMVCFLF